MTKDISKKVIQTIKKQHLKSKPKWYFYLTSLLFGLSLASVLILTTIFLNLFLFHAPRFLLIFRPLPLLFFFLTAISLFLSLHLLRQNQYRHSLLAIFLGALFFIFIANNLFTGFRNSRRFPQLLHRFYQRRIPTPRPRRFLLRH